MGLAPPFPTVTVTDDRVLELGEARYSLLETSDATTPEFPVVVKSPTMIRRYVNLCRDLAPSRVIELGVFTGTSAAVFADLCPGSKLVAVELVSEPAPYLTDFIDRRNLHDSLRPYYGVDQADTVRLAEIVASEFGDHSVDLIIDDASHLLEPTRISFEALFPLVRPGGVYVIEDWECDQRFAGISLEQLDAATTEVADLFKSLRDRPPLIGLILELVVAAATSPNVIAGLTINEYMVQVERGTDTLDPGTFRLADHYHDRLGLLPG